MGGDLLIASTIFVLVTHWPYRDLPGSAAEGVALIVALIGIELLVFSNDVPATYLAFPIHRLGGAQVPAAWRDRRRAGLRHHRRELHRQRVGAVLPALGRRRPPARPELLGDRRAHRPDPGERHLPAQAGRAPGAAPGARSPGRAAASPASRDSRVRGSRLVPGRRPGTGGRRRLLRRLRDERRSLGGGDRGRLRQGARSGLADRARPLHPASRRPPGDRSQ